MQAKFVPLLALAIAALGSAHAQNAEPPTASGKPEPSVEEVTRYVTQLTDRIEKRKERATAMVNEILALDKSIQGNVDQVLNTLRGMTDSNDSRTQVARTKRDMIQRLGKVAELEHGHPRGSRQIHC